MDNLADTICSIREDVLSSHYGAAYAELREKVKNEPIRTVFYIYSGCVSKDVATEIAHRFSVGKGYSAKVCTSGLISSTFYLEVDTPLPENLIHTKVIETKIIEETKGTEEIKGKEETKEI